MRRLSTVTFMGVMALTMAGCGSDNQESSAPIPSNPQPSAKAFDKALIANQSLASPISSAPILIQPTNGNQRAKQVEKGRRDPFAGLFAQASLSVPSGGTNVGVTNSGSSSQLPRLSVPSSGRRQTGTAPSGSARPRVGQQNSGSNPSRQQSNPNTNNTGSQSNPDQTSPAQTPLPSVEPGPSFETVAPPPPQQPELASSVAVSGVIQIGNEAQAIVQVPNEGTSRYVRVGQRLSNGQVLVKRIEMNEGSDPVVILEQYGIEVARAIGSKPANGSQTTTSTDSSQPQDGGQVPQPSPSQGTQSPTEIITPTDGGSSSQPANDGSVAPLDAGGGSQLNDGSVAPTNTIPVPQPPSISPGSGVR